MYDAFSSLLQLSVFSYLLNEWNAVEVLIAIISYVKFLSTSFGHNQSVAISVTCLALSIF